MQYRRCAFLVAVLVVPALFAGAEDYDQPFAEQQQDAEFKQMETKQEMQRVHPPAVVAPGPEGPAAPILLKDRLRVLTHRRAEAVQQNKPPQEIVAIDAEIKELQEQLGVPGR